MKKRPGTRSQATDSKTADAHCAPLRANGEITVFCRGGHWPSEAYFIVHKKLRSTKQIQLQSLLKRRGTHGLAHKNERCHRLYRK